MKKRGFTLIELLAVIVILAIIALIVTPLVLKYIEKARSESTIRSAENYLDAVENSIINKIMDNPTFKPTSCDVQSDGNLKCNGIDVKVEIKGEVPSSGTITLENGKIKDVQLVLSEKTITKNTEGKLVYGEAEVQLESGLYDAEGNLIVTWDELEKAGIILDKDYIDENGQLIVDDISELPGIILSTNEKLKQGTKLVIDSSVKTLGSGALGGCTNLKEITIPNSVTSIGGQAFVGCTSLEKVIIGNGVTSIDYMAFSNCTGLEKITIPDSVTSIASHIFQNCTNLKEVIIGNNSTIIGTAMFEGCTSLEKITIPNSVTTIGGDAFIDCTSLEKITIPNSVTSIGENAFYSCTSLKTINYTGTQEQWNTISFGTKWDLNTPTDMVINYNYVIPQN